MTLKLKCHNCGEEKETELHPKEFVCKNCGAVNVVAYDNTSEDSAACIPPTSFEWTLPAGVLEGPSGKIYVSAQGSHMSKEEYIDTFGLDPDLSRAWMKKMGEEGKEGYFNTSTLGKKRKK